MLKTLRYGADGFTSPPKEGALQIFIELGRVWTCESWAEWQARYPLQYRGRLWTYIRHDNKISHSYVFMQVAELCIIKMGLIWQCHWVQQNGEHFEHGKWNSGYGILAKFGDWATVASALWRYFRFLMENCIGYTQNTIVQGPYQCLLDLVYYIKRKE
jgi:hypothetical protein